MVFRTVAPRHNLQALDDLVAATNGMSRELRVVGWVSGLARAAAHRMSTKAGGLQP
jgi:hypothetical protein